LTSEKQNIFKMKAVIVLGALVASVAAQDISSLPACGVSPSLNSLCSSVPRPRLLTLLFYSIGCLRILSIHLALPLTSTPWLTSRQQTCMNNMIALAPSLGCSASDAACLCKNVNFQYGIRDCSNAVCGDQTASTVISFGSQYCQCKSLTS